MSFREFVLSVEASARSAGIALPMSKLRDAISLACHNRPYSACLAAEKASSLPPISLPPPYLEATASLYRISPIAFSKAFKTICWRDRIVTDPETLGGKPFVFGTRLSVEFILERLDSGWSEETLLESYPQISRDDLDAIQYFDSESMAAQLTVGHLHQASSNQGDAPDFDPQLFRAANQIAIRNRDLLLEQQENWRYEWCLGDPKRILKATDAINTLVGSWSDDELKVTALVVRGSLLSQLFIITIRGDEFSASTDQLHRLLTSVNMINVPSREETKTRVADEWRYHNSVLAPAMLVPALYRPESMTREQLRILMRTSERTGEIDFYISWIAEFGNGSDVKESLLDASILPGKLDFRDGLIRPNGCDEAVKRAISYFVSNRVDPVQAFIAYHLYRKGKPHIEMDRLVWEIANSLAQCAIAEVAEDGVEWNNPTLCFV